MAEGREVSRWRWLGGWPKGRGEGPYEVKRAENRPLPASHSPRSPAEAWVCGIVPLRYFTFPVPSWGPRGCLRNARPLSPALLLRRWGLPDRGLGGLSGRRCVQRLSGCLRLGRSAPPPDADRLIALGLLLPRVGGQPSLWFRQLQMLLASLLDMGSVPWEPLWLLRVTLSDSWPDLPIFSGFRQDK